MKKSITGQYNKKGTFRIYTGKAKKDGLDIANYVDGATVWCGVIDIRGKELFEAMAAQAENTIRFKMRYMSGIDDEWLFKVDGIDYEIISIQDLGLMHREIVLVCKVVT